MKNLKNLLKVKAKTITILILSIIHIFVFVVYIPLLIAISYGDAMEICDGWIIKNIQKQNIPELSRSDPYIETKQYWPYTVKITVQINNDNDTLSCYYVSVALFGLNIASVAATGEP